jgi:nucleotide-binding universal stress UspA family protein
MTAIKHILFPFDFSPQCLEAAPFVRAFATRLEAKVTVLSVAPPTWESPPEGMRPLPGESPREWVDALQHRLNHALMHELQGVRVDRVAECGDPAMRIATFARANRVDLVMMPTHGLGAFRRLLAGSVTSKVLHDATCPVWTAAHAETQRAANLPRRVLCAVDGTPKGGALLLWANAFCHVADACLTALHVVDPLTDWPSSDREHELQEGVRAEARAHLERSHQAAGLRIPIRVAVGDIVNTVVEEAAQEQADLVIVGRGAITEPFGRLRTHAFGIVQRSPCPVLSV